MLLFAKWIKKAPCEYKGRPLHMRNFLMQQRKPLDGGVYLQSDETANICDESSKHAVKTTYR